MSIATTRTSLATALKGAGRVVHAFPKEAITPPAIVIVPASPYVEAQAIGGLTTRVLVNFDVTVIVGAADNQAALANIEGLMMTVWSLLPDGYSVQTWSQPQIQEVSGNQLLTAQCTVSTAIQIGN